jgi:hypothetical protein
MAITRQIAVPHFQRANSKSGRHFGKTPGEDTRTIDLRKLWSNGAAELSIRFAIPHVLSSFRLSARR